MPSSMSLKGCSDELLYVGFNQDNSCFACGTSSGFQIFNCFPFRQTFKRKFNSDIGGVGIVEMLFRCNILALVSIKMDNKVMLWDDHQNRVIGELIFDGEVKAVKLSRDLVVVVLINKIYVYNFGELKRVEGDSGVLPTIENKLGLCALCPSSDNSILACPDEVKGRVRIENYGKRRGTLPPLRFQAHETDIVAITLTLDGTMVATASEKGTLIRVFSCLDGSPIHELRRGTDRAFIYSLCFDQSNRFLASSSDKGTIHVFSLDGSFKGAIGDESEDINNNKHSSLGFISGLLPKYFSSVWSFAQLRLPESKSICAFGSELNTLIVIGGDGSYYKTDFSKGGECEKKEYSKLLTTDEDIEKI